MPTEIHLEVVNSFVPLSCSFIQSCIFGHLDDLQYLAEFSFLDCEPIKRELPQVLTEAVYIYIHVAVSFEVEALEVSVFRAGQDTCSVSVEVYFTCTMVLKPKMAPW